MSDVDEVKKGLQCLDDEALVQMVEQALEIHGELQPGSIGEAAFRELERRTPS